MKYHILNGDALLEKLTDASIQGNYIVMRECLVDGEFYPLPLNEFWDTRAQFLEKNYGVKPDEYFTTCVAEFERIQSIPENASIYLWFERDLFCQVNLWFTLSYLKSVLVEKNLYPFLVLPHHHVWTGFGSMSVNELVIAYGQKTMLRRKDIQFFADVWQAFRQHDLENLMQLALLTKNRFPYLTDVVQAHADRFPIDGYSDRPSKVVQEIFTDLQTTEFLPVFKEFSKREGIYGFGDLQFKRIYEQAITKRT